MSDRHDFIAVDQQGFDSNCVTCEGKKRDAVHHQEGSREWFMSRGVKPEHYELCVKDYGLGVKHIWTNVMCPSYRTLDPADCVCRS